MEMRHTIRPLDPQVVGKIAAGEVVERPAYAIKELIENSIDAGATSVNVEIRDGGLSYFRVTDNGCGIAPSEIRMAFARHATSKLRRAEELEAIHTLGFRGEALASIAAVARVEMVTRQEGQESGVKAVVEGGVIGPLQDAASPEGTSITVRDLFFNTPARRKFLKRPATEAGLVSDLVLRLILARPDISFRLQNGDRQVYYSPGNGSLRDAMFCVLGKEVLPFLAEVKGAAAGCAVYGFVGIGEAARGSRATQTFILNGRYVRNGFLSQALEEGCRERVMIGKYPICALHLTMPFEAVDVNVHPNKLEVRFQDERMLMTGLSAIVRDAFVVEPLAAATKLSLQTDEKPTVGNARGQEMTPVDDKPTTLAPQPVVLPPDRPPVRLRDSALSQVRPVYQPAVFTPPSPNAPLVDASMEDVEPMQMALPPVEQMPEKLRLVGIAFLEYVFAEQGDMLYIIDQHAAHERILYERFTRALEQETASQQLLTPMVVQLTHREHTAVLGQIEALQELGFDLEDFGDRTLQIRAVPMVLGTPQLKTFFGEYADSLSEYRALPTQEKRRDALVKLACRKAVKAGDPLSLESVQRLIEEMRETGAPPTCPHGRPLVIAIAKVELDKRFRRIL